MKLVRVAVPRPLFTLYTALSLSRFLFTTSLRLSASVSLRLLFSLHLPSRAYFFSFLLFMHIPPFYRVILFAPLEISRTFSPSRCSYIVDFRS